MISTVTLPIRICICRLPVECIGVAGPSSDPAPSSRSLQPRRGPGKCDSEAFVSSDVLAGGGQCVVSKLRRAAKPTQFPVRLVRGIGRTVFRVHNLANPQHPCRRILAFALPCRGRAVRERRGICRLLTHLSSPLKYPA